MRQSSLAKIGNVDAVSISIDREIASRYDDVKIVADNIDDVVAVANAAATTAAVADNIDVITAVGSSIADIVAVNSNIVDVTSIADNIVDVSTVATNIGNINSVATTVVPNMAEILLADDKAAIATSMAATATTQAELADTARVAAEAAQGIAETKADAASASAAVATTKANAASASASAAHNSELAAAAMLDAFDDRYLGSFVVDPATDNDGQPLLDGALYFNTSVNVLKVYDVGTTTWYTIPQVRLSGLLDVQLTSIATGDVLKWDGTEWVNTNEFSSHIVATNNPHNVTKSQVGLDKVDNTSDATKNVLSATKLTTARAISLTGDVTGTVNFDGSVGVSIAAVVADDSHAHGNSTITDVDWTKISNKPGPIVTVELTGDVTGTANTTLTNLGNGTITVNTAVGDDSHLHSFANLTSKPTTLSGYGITDAINVSQKGVANGVATLDASGLVPVGQLPSYVDDVLEYTNLGAFPAVGEPGKIYVALDTNKTYRWSGSAYVYITSGAVDSVAGKTGVVSLVKADVGLSNVDNTSDLLKPISTATAAEFALKAPLASPALTGTPTAPTASVGTNTTQLATTAFVNAEIANDTYSKTELNTSNILRADKYLAAQNIANMVYAGGDLAKIQYNAATDVDYEVLSYTTGNLTGIAHYVGSVLKGNSVLSYTGGDLTSVVFTGV